MCKRWGAKQPHRCNHRTAEGCCVTPQLLVLLTLFILFMALWARACPNGSFVPDAIPKGRTLQVLSVQLEGLGPTSIVYMFVLLQTCLFYPQGGRSGLIIGCRTLNSSVLLVAGMWVTRFSGNFHWFFIKLDHDH